MELHLVRLNPELPLSRRTLRYVSASRREKSSVCGTRRIESEA